MALWKVVRIGSQVVRRIVLFVMGLVTMLNLGPTATMALSMLVSLFFYAAAFGVHFAVGFIILLFLHELGHLIATRVVGIAATGPLFVPFVGAVINLRKAPVNAKMEANIAIGGPAMGTLSALGCLVLYFWTDSMLMLVLAYTACLLNLFNLIPCTPLDGGRIAVAISPHLWWVGSIVLALLFFWTHNILILVIFFFSLVRLWKGDKSDNNEKYFQLTLYQRLTVAWWYFGLLAVLGLLALYLVELLH